MLLDQLGRSWVGLYLARRYLEFTLPEPQSPPRRTECNGICGPGTELLRYLLNFLGEKWVQGPRDERLSPIDMRRQIVGCSCQNIEMMRLFEDYGLSFAPDKVPRYRDGFNYLHQAASGLYVRTLEFLLDQGWNVDQSARQHQTFCTSEHGLAVEFQSNWFRAFDVPMPDHQFHITPLLECLIQCRVQDFGLDNSEWISSSITISKKQELMIERIWAAATVLINAGASLDCDGLSPVKFWLPAELSNLKGNQDLEISRRMLIEYAKRGGSFQWALVERGFRNDSGLHRFTEFDSEIRRFAPSLIQDIVRILAEGPGTDLEVPREWWKTYQEDEAVDHQTPLCKMAINYLGSRGPKSDTNYQNSEAGKHHLACLKILVDAGASTEVLTVKRHSVTHVAAAFRCEEVLDILCKGDWTLVRRWMTDEETWKELCIGTRAEVMELYTRWNYSSQGAWTETAWTEDANLLDNVENYGLWSTPSDFGQNEVWSGYSSWGSYH